MQYVRFVSKRHALTTDGWVVRGECKPSVCAVPSLFPDTRSPRAARSLSYNRILDSDTQDKLRSDHPNIQFKF